MQVGVDFGTTRTLVSIVDRGNYPVVSFTDSAGDSYDYLPSVAALVDGDLVYGFDALAAMDEGAPGVRSFKRALASPDVGVWTRARFGEWELPVTDLLAGYLGYVADQLRTSSNIADRLAGDLTAVVAVPAHAHSAQRFLTLQAFRAAGFTVTAILNEPSAAGFEYTHRQARTLSSKRSRVLVYDLGGGTFDASLVSVQATAHEVVDTVGINTLGGDDFDLALAGLAVEAAGRQRHDLDAFEWAALLDDCRVAKEGLSPQSRRLSVDVAGTPVTIPVAAFYDAVTPLVNRTVDALAPLVSGLGDEPELADVAGIYLVGGASGLPLVPRVLRERFGRRVHRSPHPAASTAIGLAIAADDQAGFDLTDRLSRGFGVFREASFGAGTSFDPIFGRDLVVRPGEVVSVSRQYRAVHNIGHFRFVEYSGLGEGDVPRGEIVPFAELVFPFDERLQREGVGDEPVVRRDWGPLVEETYRVAADGVIEVEIADLDTGFVLRTSLG